jgi:hypothetical protein
MDAVYILWHVHSVDGTEDEKLIGVYRSEDDASAVVLKLRDKPGFRETLDGFSIDRYPLNRTHWEEGFVRVGA